MWRAIKRLFARLMGHIRPFVEDVMDTVLDRAAEIVKDREVVSLALKAIRAAVDEGLTGDKAWVKARDAFTKGLKDSGKEIGNTAIDTTLQVVYDAWHKHHINL